MSSDRPDSLRYSTDHCWARLEDDATVTVGLTAFAQSALGAVVYAGLPAVESTVAANDAIGEVESTKAVTEIYAPVGGTVVAVNDGLSDQPGVINSAPYSDGWICVIAPSDPREYERLLSDQEYGDLTDSTENSQPST